MSLNLVPTIIQEAGKLAGLGIQAYINRPVMRKKQESEPDEVPIPQKTSTKIELPTSEETTQELKRRLARELYRAELDLANGLMIAGKPCDCLSNKHTLEIDASAEELVSQDPENSVYQEIRSWIVKNQSKLTPEAILSGQFKQEYPRMALQFKNFRKRILGSTGESKLVASPPTQPLVIPLSPIESSQESQSNKSVLTLEEAKRRAADLAMQEVERQWTQNS